MRKQRNIEFGKRLREVQYEYGKSDAYMGGLLEYNKHSYDCLCNGDFVPSFERLQNMCNDAQLAHKLPYIINGIEHINPDYSTEAILRYIERLPRDEAGEYVKRLMEILIDTAYRK